MDKNFIIVFAWSLWIAKNLIVCFLLPATAAVAEELRVTSGQKIQEAVARARPGDTILVEPGTYREAVYIDKEDVSLVGIVEKGRWPILDGDGKLNDAVIASGSGFKIKNFYIRDYRANGVMTQGANDVDIRNLIVEDTGLYGIYPTSGDNITIEDTVTSGIEDAGIYVGQCTHVDVRRNELFHNVAGIESENSEFILIEENYVHDNAGGILIFALPGLPRKVSANTLIRGNFIVNNNHRNFAEVGSIVSTTPPGSGIVLLATDRVTIVDNVISGNSTAGLIIADHEFLPATTPDPEVDPYPESTRVLDNMFLDNGRKSFLDYIRWFDFLILTIRGSGMPEGTLDQMIPDSGDLYVWGKGSDNCVKGLKSLTSNSSTYFNECGPNIKKPDIVSMAALHSPDTRQQFSGEGEKIFASVCSGCHGEADRVIGPPMIEVRKKYRDNLSGLVKFVIEPKKVRSGYPPMPSHAYLGKEKIEAVAQYILDQE